MGGRIDDDWLNQFLQIAHISYNRAMLFSADVHTQSSRNEILEEFITNKSEQMGLMIEKDSHSENNESHFEQLKRIHYLIEEEDEEPSVWFDSLTFGHGCSNMVIDMGGDNPSAVTYPAMKTMLLSNDVDNSTCRSCVINRHVVSFEHGLNTISTRHIPTECIFRPTTLASRSGIGFKLDIKQSSRVRLDHEEQSGSMRLHELIITPDLKSRIEKVVGKDFLKNQNWRESNDVSGKFQIMYTWSTTISSNTSLVGAWQRSGLGRKEKRLSDEDGSAHMIDSFEAILDDMGGLVKTIESSWSPLRMSSIDKIFSRNEKSDGNTWPIYRIWCPSSLLQIIKGDHLLRLPLTIPFFISNDDDITPTEDETSIVIELDGILLWR